MSTERKCIREISEKLNKMMKDEEMIPIFELAFARKKIEDKIQDQADPFMDHLLKIQLFHEPSAYQTLYNIYTILWKVKRADKEQYFDKQYYQDNIAEGFVPDENAYYGQVEGFLVQYAENYPVTYPLDYGNYKRAATFIVDLIFDPLIPRSKFDERLKEILE